MAWEIEVTDEFRMWWYGLTRDQKIAVDARIEQLEIDGPHLRGTLVTPIQQSRHFPRLKELRCNEEGHLRILFCFDPRRVCIVLLGGDKWGEWETWYDHHVPAADDLYDEYLQELLDEGLLP